jgi:hypothetical protein
MVLQLVAVVSVPLRMIEVRWNRLNAQKNKRGLKCLGVQFCHGSVEDDGKRLLLLTREKASDDRPKRFCAVLCSKTLFVQDSEFIAFPILQGGNNRCVTIH